MHESKRRRHASSLLVVGIENGGWPLRNDCTRPRQGSPAGWPLPVNLTPSFQKSLINYPQEFQILITTCFYPLVEVQLPGGFQCLVSFRVRSFVPSSSSNAGPLVPNDSFLAARVLRRSSLPDARPDEALEVCLP
jgi:hypothetical protein